MHNNVPWACNGHVAGGTAGRQAVQVSPPPGSPPSGTPRYTYLQCAAVILLPQEVYTGMAVAIVGCCLIITSLTTHNNSATQV